MKLSVIEPQTKLRLPANDQRLQGGSLRNLITAGVRETGAQLHAQPALALPPSPPLPQAGLGRSQKLH